MMVSIPADTDLKTYARADGHDILFTDGSGTKLNHEIESYDSNTGTLVAWVDVLSLSDGASVYLYYGNSSAADQSNAAPVWANSSYAAVYHLKETGIGTGTLLKDSTANGKNLTVALQGSGSPGTITSVAGAAGQGVNITGGNQYNGYYGKTSGLSGMGIANTTIEGWVHVNSFWQSDGAYYGIFGSANGAYPYQADWLKLTTGGIFQVVIGNQGTSVGSTPTGISAGGWHHVAATYDHSNVVIYVDGAPAVTSAFTGTLVEGAFQLNCLAVCADASYDEVRASNGLRTAAWILTEYRNQGAPGTFYAVGVLESHP